MVPPQTIWRDSRSTTSSFLSQLLHFLVEVNLIMLDYVFNESYLQFDRQARFVKSTKLRAHEVVL